MTPDDCKTKEWLKSIGLEIYAEKFVKNDVSLEILHSLTNSDLRELGVSLGHRHILIEALRQTRTFEQKPGLHASISDHAERRQVTVMFCDLVGSTELSAQLDLDSFRTLMHEYYSSCCQIIEASGGFIANLIGDGILAYFGYPNAREDAAECAMHSGLEILKRLGSGQLAGQSNVRVRIGVATGLTVISDMMGVGFSEQNVATGRIPNLAARIQALATPGSMAVADETRHLAGSMFEYADMGWNRFKGFDQLVRVWRVNGELEAKARFEAHRSELLECHGRHPELEILHKTWHRVGQGICHVGFVMGDAGIGKSRLIYELVNSLDSVPVLLAQMQCSPNQAGTPLYPLISWIRRVAGVTDRDPEGNRQRLESWLGEDHDPFDLILLADLLVVPVQDLDNLPAMAPDRKRLLTRDLVINHFERHCRLGPVLILIEDLHWVDSSTKDFLGFLFQKLRDQPLLGLLSSRTEDTPSWVDGQYEVRLRLQRLGRHDAEKLIQSICHEKSLPASVVSEIIDKTDGVPLFIEELTATVLESGDLNAESGKPKREGHQWTIDIPTVLRDSLTARLDRLGSAKKIAEIASVLGREFSFSLIAQVTGKSIDFLTVSLDRLVEAQLLYQRGTAPEAEYIFKHALVKDVAYDGQMKIKREEIHGRIVDAIVNYDPELARREPGLMAYHCELGNRPTDAVEYLRLAGLASTQIVAIAEALKFFERAYELIRPLPMTPYLAEQQIRIIVGWMEVGRFAILPDKLIELGERARYLISLEGVTCDAETKAAILFQEGRAQLYSGRYSAARGLFVSLRKLGIDVQSTSIERKPASAFSMTLCCQGLFDEALAFSNAQNVEYYKRPGSLIDYISCLGWIGYASCQTGHIEEGLFFGDLSVREAKSVQSEIYLGGAYVWRSHALMSARRFAEAAADASQCLELSKVHTIPYLRWHALVFLALCECRGGNFDEAQRAIDQARILLSHEVPKGKWTLLDYIPAIESEMACFRGEYSKAIVLAEHAIEVAGPIDGYFAAAIAWRARAISLIRLGKDLGAAQESFEQAVSMCELGGARSELTFGLMTWSHALWSAGHLELARKANLKALNLADRYSFDIKMCEYGSYIAL